MLSWSYSCIGWEHGGTLFVDFDFYIKIISRLNHQKMRKDRTKDAGLSERNFYIEFEQFALFHFLQAWKWWKCFCQNLKVHSWKWWLKFLYLCRQFWHSFVSCITCTNEIQFSCYYNCNAIFVILTSLPQILCVLHGKFLYPFDSLYLN